MGKAACSLHRGKEVGHDAPAVIVLAAGHGRRFALSGGTTSKLEALLHGIPVLEHVLRSVMASGLPFHVVRPEPGDSSAQLGMGDSIARGIAATTEARGWLILPGDLPLIRPQTILNVARGLMDYPIVLPVHNARQGHPVGFGSECRAALTALHGDRGAAHIVREYRQLGKVLELPQEEDEGVVMDIDTIEDLARAEKMLATRQVR
nr:nucleotidyltransferase family protein [Xanthomonas euvesicatoria]